MMAAAYRGCMKLSTHILCLLRGGHAVAAGAAAIGDGAGAGAVTATVHAHEMATFTQTARREFRVGRSAPTREAGAAGDRYQRHEQRADDRAHRGRPVEKPRRAGADRSRDADSPPADLNRHGLL